MITEIKDTFKKLAREHKLIKSFHYKENWEKGEGNDIYPLFWLEQPIQLQNTGAQGNGFSVSVNFCILFVRDEKNEDKSDDYFQTLAFSVGLNILEYIKKYKEEYVYFTIDDDYVVDTVTRYYDDSSIGCRFSVNIWMKNKSNYCLIEEQFDNTKDFDSYELLNDFKITPNIDCEVYTEKIPDFTLRFKKD